MAAFTPNIPATGQSLGNSRDKVRDNFTALRNQVAVNHSDILQSSSGKHTFIQYVVQGSDPATSANEIARYTKLVSGVAREFLRLPSNGTVIQVSGNAPVSSTNGYTYLPGGLLLQWGTATAIPTGGNKTVVFPVAFSATPHNISVTGIRSNNGGDGIFVSSGSVTTTQFVMRNGSSSITTAYWMAIGPE